jgi:hypothetical protein
MICALTVRTLKPGTFDDFRVAFMGLANPDDIPDGWVRFDMIRGIENPDEVICFGFFDGTVEELRRAAAEQGYAKQQASIAPFVAAVGADGLYEVVEDLTLPR